MHHRKVVGRTSKQRLRSDKTVPEIGPERTRHTFIFEDRCFFGSPELRIFDNRPPLHTSALVWNRRRCLRFPALTLSFCFRLWREESERAKVIGHQKSDPFVPFFVGVGIVGSLYPPQGRVLVETCRVNKVEAILFDELFQKLHCRFNLLCALNAWRDCGHHTLQLLRLAERAQLLISALDLPPAPAAFLVQLEQACSIQFRWGADELGKDNRQGK